MDGKTQSYPLIDEKTRIGRGKVGNEIAVPEVIQSVSRQHLEIRREKGGYRQLLSRGGAPQPPVGAARGSDHG